MEVERHDRDMEVERQATEGATHVVLLAQALAVGARARDVEEGLLLAGGQRRRGGARVAPPGRREGRGGRAVTPPPDAQTLHAGRGAHRPGPLPWRRGGGGGTDQAFASEWWKICCCFAFYRQHFQHFLHTLIAGRIISTVWEQD